MQNEECGIVRFLHSEFTTDITDNRHVVCHSHENGNPVSNFLDSRFRGNDNHLSSSVPTSLAWQASVLAPPQAG